MDFFSFTFYNSVCECLRACVSHNDGGDVSVCVINLFVCFTVSFLMVNLCLSSSSNLSSENVTFECG